MNLSRPEGALHPAALPRAPHSRGSCATQLWGHCPFSPLMRRRIKSIVVTSTPGCKSVSVWWSLKTEAASKYQLAISRIRPRNEGEKELRSIGHRPVEFVFSFVCNKTPTPGGLCRGKPDLVVSNEFLAKPKPT